MTLNIIPISFQTIILYIDMIVKLSVTLETKHIFIHITVWAIFDKHTVSNVATSQCWIEAFLRMKYLILCVWYPTWVIYILQMYITKKYSEVVFS